MKILASGFEPFDGDSVNSSEELVRALSELDHPFDFSSVILPVSFDLSFKVFLESIKKFSPDVIVGFGLAKSRTELSVERVAINWMEARRPDNLGLQPIGEKIHPEGVDGLFSNLPLSGMVQAAIAAGVSSTVSNTAGTFVCNSLMYEILQYCGSNKILGGFVHVPMSAARGGEDQMGMNLDDMLAGARAMLNEICCPQFQSKTVNFGQES